MVRLSLSAALSAAILASLPLAAAAATGSPSLGQPTCREARDAVSFQERSQVFAALRPREHAVRLIFLRDREAKACAAQLRAGASPDSMVVTPEANREKSASGPMLIAPPGLCVIQNGQTLCP